MSGAALFGLDGLLPPTATQDAVQNGEVFTRRWVVELVLDLAGYTEDRDLATLRVIEPACGGGAFLEVIAERLSRSCLLHGRGLADAVSAVEAFDLIAGNVTKSREVVTRRLAAAGWDTATISSVLSSWVRHGDYLLRDDEPHRADFVVGNPPYVRLEDVPDARMNAYRVACPTMGGRADLYVGFYEKSLQNLKPDGRLAFICADRWMRNQYGQRLRDMIVRRYAVDLVLSMHDVDAFDDQVSAYPAITVVRNGRQGRAVVADAAAGFGEREASDFRRWVDSTLPTVVTSTYHATRLPHWFPAGDSWPVASPARLAVLEDLSDRFGLLEDRSTGTRVSIGVATGADDVFITHEADRIDVEPDRLLPLAMVRDTRSGILNWHGAHLINPWTPSGDLVDLRKYPRLAEHYERYGPALRRRYVAGKQPDRWYKTIDKVDSSLTSRPKLLLPDMKTFIHPVLDEGGLYPHHNLYYIVSDAWDLRVLGGLLLSKIAEAFVAAYAVKMRGGTLRFQAQYLRKIRVPHPAAIAEADRVDLRDAFARRDVAAATRAALRVYGIESLPD